MVSDLRIGSGTDESASPNVAVNRVLNFCIAFTGVLRPFRGEVRVAFVLSQHLLARKSWQVGSGHSFDRGLTIHVLLSEPAVLDSGEHGIAC